PAAEHHRAISSRHGARQTGPCERRGYVPTTGRGFLHRRRNRRSACQKPSASISRCRRRGGGGGLSRFRPLSAGPGGFIVSQGEGIQRSGQTQGGDGEGNSSRA